MKFWGSKSDQAPNGWSLRHTLSGHTVKINRICWTPDGTRLVTAADDKTARVWDVETGEELHRLVHGSEDQRFVFDVDVTSDGHFAITGTRESLKVWNLGDGSLEQTIDDFGPMVTIVPHARTVITLRRGTDDIVLLDLSTFQSLKLTDSVQGYGPFSAVTPDGKTAITTGNRGRIAVWDIETRKRVNLLTEHASNADSDWDREVRALTVTPDGKKLVAGSADNRIYIYDLESGRLQNSLEAHTESVTGVTVSPDGQLLASKGWQEKVRIWRCSDWQQLSVLEESEGSTYVSVMPAFHPTDSNVLATFGESQLAVRLWDLDLSAFGVEPLPEQAKYTTAKLVLVGDSGVGKTGLGWRLAHDEFKEHESTHGQQFWVVEELGQERADGTDCEAVLWDLAGQPIYGHVHPLFLDNVNLALLLFDPTKGADSLQGVEFWVGQLSGKDDLPPAVLVGARVDRGDSTLSGRELSRFCQHHGIAGGYIRTSAKSGVGITDLTDTIRALIPWDEMSSTVTTATFKRIKQFVLSLKESTERDQILVSPDELRNLLREAEPDSDFSDVEMMTAVGHLETHGYVSVLKRSNGDKVILLTPDLLVNLASSIVLEASRHPRELGALSETALTKRGLPVEELEGLSSAESEVLCDAAVLRFIEHSICFRSHLGADTLLIFPGLIRRKRPLFDEVETVESTAYVVRGAVEHVYTAQAVLLGYTQSFTRVDQWVDQAQFEMGPGEICGFRQVEGRSGKIELVLYYSVTTPPYAKSMFQGLFEKFLYQHDVDVTSYPPVHCPNGHLKERETVIRLLQQGKNKTFCSECGEPVTLPVADEPTALGAREQSSVARGEAMARLRKNYELSLSRVKSFRRDREAPRCYVSFHPDSRAWANRLGDDLMEAGVYIVKDAADLEADDSILALLTTEYKDAFDQRDSSLSDDLGLLSDRLTRADNQRAGVIPLLIEGDRFDSTPDPLTSLAPGDFRDDTHYTVGLFDLVLSLYAISLTHPTFKPLRDNLERRWSQVASRLGPQPEVFLSYAWGGLSEEVADELEQSFGRRGIRIVRDKRDVGFKGNIWRFMETIGEGKCVIAIISDQYLKSRACCFELVHVAANEDFYDRIFPIVLNDAQIYDPADRIGYVQYWEGKKSELDGLMKTVSAANLDGFREDIDLYEEIRRLLPGLLDVFRRMNTLSTEAHRESNFKDMYEAITHRLEQ